MRKITVVYRIVSVIIGYLYTQEEIYMKPAAVLRGNGSRLIALVLFSVVFWRTGLADAQPQLDRSFEVQNYDPAIGPGQFITVESTAMPGHLQYGLSLDYTFQHRPLSIFLVEDGDLKTENIVIEHQNTLFAHGFFGINTRGLGGNYLFRQIQFGISLPIYFQSGELDVSGYPMPSNTPSQIRGFGIGDMRIHLKTSLWRFLNEKLRLAMSTTVTLPWVGDIPNYRAENNFIGEKNVTVRPRLIAEFVHRDLRIGANAGFIARVEESQFFSTTVGHQFTYGAAGEYAFWEGTGLFGVRLAGLVEIVGRNGLSMELDENPLEVDAGIRVGFPWGLSFLAGGGAGLIKAVGSPVWRTFFRIEYSPALVKDSDGDGVPDYRDKCPFKPGPAMYHGCPPELVDSDGDGIPDYLDKCPHEPEDLDGFQDEDGCPDPDNDGDGICDPNETIQANLEKYKYYCEGRDLCPMHSGPAKYSGCPREMLDRDGDGIPDYLDKCPDEAENVDGHHDEDGCPDPGPPPPEPEPVRTEEDVCPAPDEDSDVTVEKERLVLKRQIRFRGTSTRLVPPSEEILQQVVPQLKCRLEFVQNIVVVGFVEPLMPEAKAKKISQAWADAVKEYLVKAGIPADKIVARGLGGIRPIYEGTSRTQNREINRRVEFYFAR